MPEKTTNTKLAFQRQAKITLISVLISAMAGALSLTCATMELDEFENGIRNQAGPRFEVPAEIQEFAQAFFREGRLRGRNLPMNNQIIKFTERPFFIDAGNCGGCEQIATRNGPQNLVYLFRDTHCFTAGDRALEELTVFHELSHCLLNRDHLNDTLPNGEAKSIMAASVSAYYSGPNRHKRKYYLDELFRPGTPAPAWAR